MSGRPADAFVFFGGTGDLAYKKIFPALHRLTRAGRLGVPVICVARGGWNLDRLREYAESSPSIVTPLNRYLGYEEAASIAKQSLKERKTIRQVVIERGHVEAGRLTEPQLDEALDVMRMTRP